MCVNINKYKYYEYIFHYTFFIIGEQKEYPTYFNIHNIVLVNL